MAEQKFTIYVEDVGDRSVGLTPITTLKAELDENMVEHLIDNKLLGRFEEALEKLVNDFFEPEISYRTFDTRDLEDEAKYENGEW